MYGCLKVLAEKKGGCDVSKTLARLLETSTSVNVDDLCPNVTEIHHEVKRQGPWTEGNMAENGCTPSCTRSTFELQVQREGVHRECLYV